MSDNAYFIVCMTILAFFIVGANWIGSRERIAIANASAVCLSYGGNTFVDGVCRAGAAP